jgi:Zn-dependent protease with chaperone function
MSAPSEAPDAGVAVWYYDGSSALKRSGQLVLFDDTEFALDSDGTRSGPYRFTDLVALDAHGASPRFGRRKAPGWQLGFVEEIPPALVACLPGTKRYGGLIDRIGLWPAAIAATLVSACVVALVLNTPSLVARLVPRAAEARMGDLMVGDFGGRACTSPAGDAALRALAYKLGASVERADIRVVDVPMVNAITLPGGHVLLFSGLLRDAESPDEVAGVLAHELGHVDHRDVLTALIRQFGLSVVFGGLDGKVGGYSNALLSASYSRDAEAQADGFAIAALDRARISPIPTAQLFERFAKMQGKGNVLIAYLASHPFPADRKARFAASAKGSFTPALDAYQWEALKTICAGKKDGEDGFRF